MKRVGRREFLRATGLLGAGAVAIPGVASGRTSELASLDQLAAEAEAEGLLNQGCTVTASDVEGPFYKDLNLVRKDVTESEVGLPLGIVLLVRRASDCKAIQGAVCDLWHTNAPGNYSGFASEGTAGKTWLRGIQVTDANGIACFKTVYPGWYPGRTTHVHVKVRPEPNKELTTQLYFPDSVTDKVYKTAPYDQRGPKPTSNNQDFFFEANRMFTIKRRRSGVVVGGFRLTVA